MVKKPAQEQEQEIPAEQGDLSKSQTQEIKEGRYFSIRQIAEEFNYSTAWITNLVHSKRIAGIKPTGGSWRIPASEMERLRKEGIPPLPRPTPFQKTEEITVSPEHHDRVVSTPKEKKEDEQEEGKEGEELEWPFNLFLTKE